MIVEKRAGQTAGTFLAAWLFWREVDGLRKPRTRKLKQIRRVINGMQHEGGKRQGYHAER